MASLLRLEDVHVSYGDISALKGVSLRVEQGEIVTLIGANGAGKTTTLKTISGLLKPRRGSVAFEGRELTRLHAKEIVSLGVVQVPEGRRIFPEMTVMENLEMGAATRRDRNNIKGDLELVFSLFPVLKQRLGQKGGSLSGGEQQMLAVGRGLMARPKLFLLDEPSLGLAPLMVEKIAEIILSIHQQGTTILLVEQNAVMALKLADRAYVLETGRTVLEGPGRDLLDHEQVKKAYLGL